MAKDAYPLIEAATSVYVMQWDGKAKIGISRDPAKRMRQLQLANPGEVSLVGARVFTSRLSAVAVEKLLHRKFGSKRLLGEWFDVAPGKALDAVMAAIDPELHHPHWNADMPHELACTGALARWKWHRDRDLILAAA